MDDKAEKIALFRYGLIAPLVLETLPRGELTRRAQELLGQGRPGGSGVTLQVVEPAERQRSVTRRRDGNGMCAAASSPIGYSRGK
jgi:hypothetical protein